MWCIHLIKSADRPLSAFSRISSRADSSSLGDRVFLYPGRSFFPAQNSLRSPDAKETLFRTDVIDRWGTEHMHTTGLCEKEMERRKIKEFAIEGLDRVMMA